MTIQVRRATQAGRSQADEVKNVSGFPANLKRYVFRKLKIAEQSEIHIAVTRGADEIARHAAAGHAGASGNERRSIRPLK